MRIPALKGWIDVVKQEYTNNIKKLCSTLQ